MNPEQVLKRLRLFLLFMAGFLCIGTIVELTLIGHWEGPAQILPFILSGLGLAVVLLCLIQPQPTRFRLLRWVMAVLLVGGIFGMYEHIEHNIGFALEIQPNATLGDVFFDALGGVNPLLAPGMLTVAALLALAAAYHHPLLSDK